MLAREAAGTAHLGSERYRWMHAKVLDLFTRATGSTEATAADYAAHALLAAVGIDLLDRMLADGHTVEDVRVAQSAAALAMIRGQARARTPSCSG